MIHLEEALSHGPGSSWVEHTREVAEAGADALERAGVVCHDLGKLTVPWQQRAFAHFRFPSGEAWPSPHEHAQWGGVFAYHLLKLLYPEHRLERLAIFHAVAAHHSGLGHVEAGKASLTIAQDPQAKALTVQALKRFNVTDDQSLVETAWKRTCRFFETGEDGDVDEDLDGLGSDEIVGVWLRAKGLLGRLTLLDNRSAAHQDPETRAAFNPTLPRPGPFVARTPKTFGRSSLQALRDLLQAETLRLDADLISVEAPTGCGKTEALLRLAESLLKKRDFQRIVYALPQVSILEQVLKDYLPENVAQIWNFQARAKADEYLRSKEVQDVEVTVTCLESPFSSPYNLTTFNQVWAAALSPNRKACVRGLHLTDAIIILDEIQKLPLHALLYGLPLLQNHCKARRCTLILASATPLADTPRVFPYGPPQRLPTAVRQTLLNDARLTRRRSYVKLDRKDAEGVAELVRALAQDGKRAMVLLSLVARGTFAVAKRLGLATDPFDRVTIWRIDGEDHPVVWLDGSVPPFLRQGYLNYVKKRLVDGQRVTLLTTPVVEAGVDLDFEVGHTDFIGLQSLIQRGGRVNREGRLADATLFHFEFTADGPEVLTSKAVLDRVSVESVALHGEKPTRKVKGLLQAIQRRLDQYYQGWAVDEAREEVALLDANQAMLGQELERREPTTLSDVIGASCNASRTGLSFQALGAVTDLYQEERGEKSYLVFESGRAAEQAKALIRKPSRETERRLSPHRVTLQDPLVQDLKAAGFRLEPLPHWDEPLLFRQAAEEIQF
jgi:hypothetical protein